MKGSVVAFAVISILLFTGVVHVLADSPTEIAVAEVSCPSPTWESVGDNSPIGEVFEPRTGVLTRVAVRLRNTGSLLESVTISLREGSITGPVLDSGIFLVGPGFDGLKVVEFDPPIEVDPASRHVIEVSASSRVEWARCGNVFLHGHAITGGSPAPTKDYVVRVYGYRPDLDVQVAPDDVDVEQGNSTAVLVRVRSLYGLDANVTLSLSAAGPSPIYTLSADTVSVSAGGVANATLNVTVPSDLSPGTYTVTVTGTASTPFGTVYDSAQLTVRVLEAEGNFSVEVDPSSASATRGGEASYSINVTPEGVFDETVSLSVYGLPSGVTPSFSAVSGVPPFNSTLTLEVGDEAPTGTFSFTLRASASSGEKLINLTLTITEPPGFTITANPRRIRVYQGNSTATLVRVRGHGGFSSRITLRVIDLCPGCGAHISTNGLSPDFSTTVFISTSTSTPPGNYSLRIIGHGGNLTEAISLALEVLPRPATSTATTTTTTQATTTTTQTSQPTETTPAPSLKVKASPATVKLRSGESASIAIRVEGNAVVTLSLVGLPPDAKYKFQPPKLRAPGISSLFIRAGDTTGTFTVVVTAKGRRAGVQDSATVTVRVEPKPRSTTSRRPATTALTAEGERAGRGISLELPLGISVLAALGVLAVFLIRRRGRRHGGLPRTAFWS